MNPTYQHFATHDESEHPHLWRGVVGAWAPCLGPSGTRLHDHSGRANWGTLTNMDAATDWVIDQGQYALDFDGANDFVECFASVLINPGLPFSISFWLRLNAFHIAFPGLFSFTTSDLNGFVAFANTTFPAVYAPVSFGNNAGTFARLRPSTDFSAALVGSWSHIVYAYNGLGSTVAANFSFFLNGSQVGLTSAGGFASHGNVTRLGRQGTTSNFVQGGLDDFVVRSRPIFANEAKELYQIGRGGMYALRRRRRAYSFGPSFLAAWARGSNVILQPCGVS